MKLIVVLTIAATISGMASAFTPSSKNKVASSNKNNVIMSPNSRVHVGVSTTSNNMVSMSSPFWNMSPSRSAAPAVASKTIVDRDYTVAATLLMVGIMLGLFHPSDYMFIDMLGAAFHVWFGCFIGYQTMTTRCVFNKNTFELMTSTNKVPGLQRDKGLDPKQYKNYVLGTTNEWSYDSFVNWDFFPSIHLPILVYFKETQTPKSMQIKGSLGFKQMDKRDNGQMHFFPAFANVSQLREGFEEHKCIKIGKVHGEEFM